MAKTRGSARGGAKGKGAGKRPAGKVAAPKAAPRRVASTLAVKTKVPKKDAKALIDLFQGSSVDVEPTYDPAAATLTMLRVSPTKITED